MDDNESNDSGQRAGMVPGLRNGRIMAPWDSESGRAAARKRWDAAEHTAREAIAAAFGVSDWLAGLFELVYVQATMAKEGGKGSTQAAALAVKLAGLVRDRDNGVAGPGLAELPPEVRLLGQMVRERAENDPEFKAKLEALAVRANE